MTRRSKTPATAKKASTGPRSGHRFEPVKLDSLFVVLDAIAFMERPTATQIAQFGGMDPRTAGKLLKNASQIGLVGLVDGGYVLSQAYPFKGSPEQKQAVVREALVTLKLLTSVRQFVRLGDSVDVALRKAATLSGISPFVPTDLKPLVDWAQSMGALDPTLVAEDLVDEATSQKATRHETERERRIAFLSHSSQDKPFMRQLAADLTANNIDVWLDEQRIRVGESIPEKVAQGLAESDFFLIGVSSNSIESEWVKKELNGALVNEVQRRKVHILPLRLDDSPMPGIIADKRYADFSSSYKSGLNELILAIKSDIND